MSPIVVRVFYRLSSGRDGLYSVQGHRIYLSDGDTHPPIGMVLDNYEPGTTRLFRSLVKPDMTVIDIGAHIGYYTLLAARQAGPSGKVYSFEPALSNYSVLLKNIETTGYGNIEAIQCAVSSETDRLDFHLVTQFSGTHSLHGRGFHAGDVVSVEVVSVDVFLNERGWPHVDVMKIDAEGSEIDVLTGMRRLLDRRGPLEIIMEFCPAELVNAGKNPVEMVSVLVEAGFEVQQILDDDDCLAPFDRDQMQEAVERLTTHGTSINLFFKR